MRALTLSGGGSRGAYQIGVWQALRELDIGIDIVTGTSVGALNGALVVQGSFELAKTLWETIRISDVVAVSEEENAHAAHEPGSLGWFIRNAVQKGGADVEPLRQLLETVFDEDAFHASPIDFALVTVKYPSMEPVVMRKRDIPKGMTAAYILASAACFPAFRPQDIGGVLHVDGAYYDNLPLNLAVDLGADEIIAVDLKSAGLVRRLRRRDIRVYYISPRRPLGSFLKFDPALSERNMRLGYLDAMKEFGELEGTLFTFGRGETQKMTDRLFPAYIGLLRDIGLGSADGKHNSYQHAIRRRLYKSIGMVRTRAGNHSQTPGIVVSGEIAAQLFEMDELLCYTGEEFTRLLLDAFGQMEAREAAGIAALLSVSERPAAEVIRAIGDIPRRHIVRHIFGRMEEFFRQEVQSAELLRLAGLFPREFLSAVYLHAAQSGMNTGGPERVEAE